MEKLRSQPLGGR